MRFARSLVAAVALLATAGAFAQDKVSFRLNWYLGGLHVPPAEAYGVASFYALLALSPRPPAVAQLGASGASVIMIRRPFAYARCTRSS